MQKKSYTTLSEAINDLTKKGYTFNFNIKSDCIECDEKNLQLQPEEFEIDEVHRFQEMSDVDNESILYAISSTQNNVKGLLVNAYGIYANTASAALVAKLSRNKWAGIMHEWRNEWTWIALLIFWFSIHQINNLIKGWLTILR